jgi:hypothetical protein
VVSENMTENYTMEGTKNPAPGGAGASLTGN